MISASSLARSFQDLFEKGSSGEGGTDFTVICKDMEIPVHSFVLSARSSVFQTAINGNFKEKKERRITINDFESKTVEEMIRFLYGFEIPEILENIEELLALADMYQLDDLKAATVLRMGQNIQKENVFNILEAAEKYSAENAIDNCLDFITKNYTTQDLIGNGMLDKFPRMAVAMIKKSQDCAQLR